MAAQSEEEIEAKHKQLEFTYKDYLKCQKNLQNVEINQYCFLEQIGEGAFAQIYKATHKDTQKLVAIKVLNLRSIESEQSVKVKAIRKRLAKQESKIMMKFNNRNLLKCYECFENRDLKFMVIQYCADGSLQDKIDTMKKIPEEQAVSILKQIINGVGECHKQKIIHRDLKADNILCHNGQYKLADFGFSKQLKISTEEELSRNTCLGTMTTMAPEVLKRQNYGLKADIWSVGVIFFQMLFGQCPFKSNTSAQMITQIMNTQLLKGKQYKGVRPSPQANKFIRDVLVVDVNKRLGWRQLLQHEIFKVKPQSLPATFNRRVEIKNRDAELEDIEKQFFKLDNKNVSNFTTSESFLKPQGPFCESQKQDSPTKESEIPHKKIQQEEKPSFKIQQTPLEQKKTQLVDQKQKEEGKKYGTSSDKPKQKNIHQRLKQQEKPSGLPTLPTKKPEEQKKTFTKLNPQQIQVIKKKINEQEAQIYRWAKKIHVQCLKTECIYTSIIKPIEKFKLIDLTNRRNIEMMYLIATRCLNNISPIKIEYEKRKNNSIIQEIHYGVSELYENVVQIWQKYSNMLTSKENEKMVIIKDWFSKKLSSREMKIKDRFLTGVENMAEFRSEGAEYKKIKPSSLKQEDLRDYQKEEQIEYTNEYIQEVIKELKPTDTVKDIKKYLIHYRDICRIDAQELNNRSFKEYLYLVLL